jgi:hypothetical protein
MTGISRLALVDVSWSIWGNTRPKPPESRAALHAKLLEDLLAFCPQARTSILHTPQEETLHDLVRARSLDLAGDPLLAPYRWFAQSQPPSGWLSGRAAWDSVVWIRDGLAECEEMIDRAWLEGRQEVLAVQLNLFACRIAVDCLPTSENGQDPDLPVYLCFDLRFQEHLKSYGLFTSSAICTHKPSSQAHASRDGPRPPAAGPWTLPEGVEQLRAEYYERLRRKLRGLIPTLFPESGRAVLEHQHQAPQFWIVTGDALPTDPASLPRRADDEAFGALVDILLCAPDPHTTGVAAGVLHGNALVLRRFLPCPRGGLPSYLIVSWGKTGAQDGAQDDAQQEDQTAELVRKLTDLEASAAAALFLIEQRVEAYRSLIEVYRVIAQRAARLWDQLALHLPTAKGRQLAKAHRYIELIHQILLQGIADLDLVATNARAKQEHVEDTAYELDSQFGQIFTERVLPGHQPIRESLTSAGHFGKARQEAEDSCQAAEQVKDTYKALLEGITYAFDERRARTTDFLQGLGLGLAVLLGLVAVVPEVTASALQEHAAWLQPWIGGGGSVLIAVAASMMLRTYRRRGVLLSRPYAKHYEELHAFLEACATDRLTRLQERDRTRLRAAQRAGEDMSEVRMQMDKRWNELDKQLAEQCARLLDRLPARKPRPRPWTRKARGVGLDHWGRRVERWALSALLVSERPRTFQSFPLPRLCFLYRCYPMIGPDLAPSFDRLPNSLAVSDSDFRLVITTQLTSHEDAVEEIVHWSRRKAQELARLRWDRITEDGGSDAAARMGPAGCFVEALDRLGMRAQMDPDEVERMLEGMRCGADQTQKSVHHPIQPDVRMHS